MKNVRIYQLPVEHKAKFMRLSFVRENNIMPKLEDYNLVWEGLFASDTDLDYIYTVFNTKHPAGFKGHSLSMSDVVEVDGKYYYCDSYGWEEIKFPTTIKFEANDVPQEELTGSCTPSHLAEVRNILDNRSPKMKQYVEIKKKHSDALILFRCGDFYETYNDDAKVVAKVCGITLCVSNKNDFDLLAGFPYHALDIYLPKLVRAGYRIAICDDIKCAV